MDGDRHSQHGLRGINSVAGDVRDPAALAFLVCRGTSITRDKPFILQPRCCASCPSCPAGVFARDKAVHPTTKVASLVSLVSRLILKYFLPPSPVASLLPSLLQHTNPSLSLYCQKVEGHEGHEGQHLDSKVTGLSRVDF